MTAYLIEKERANMSEETGQEQQIDEVSLRVAWHIPEDMPSRYANNVLIQAGEYEFIISLFEVQPPLLTGTPEENKTKLREMETVHAECVSRIIVSPKLIPAFISALQTELEKYETRKPSQ